MVETAVAVWAMQITGIVPLVFHLCKGNTGFPGVLSPSLAQNYRDRQTPLCGLVASPTRRLFPESTARDPRRAKRSKAGRRFTSRVR